MKDKRMGLAVQTFLSEEVGKRWKVLCQQQKKSSYELLRYVIETTVANSKELIDSFERTLKTK